MAKKRISVMMEEGSWDRIKDMAFKHNVSASVYVEMIVMQTVNYHEAMIRRLETATADEIYEMMKKLKGVKDLGETR